MGHFAADCKQHINTDIEMAGLHPTTRYPIKKLLLCGNITARPPPAACHFLNLSISRQLPLVLSVGSGKGHACPTTQPSINRGSLPTGLPQNTSFLILT